MFCLLYSPKQKIVKFHVQKQIGRSHVIFTSEDTTVYFSVSHPLLYNKMQYLAVRVLACHMLLLFADYTTRYSWVEGWILVQIIDV
jgi:hypothetical protein